MKISELSKFVHTTQKSQVKLQKLWSLTTKKNNNNGFNGRMSQDFLITNITLLLNFNLLETDNLTRRSPAYYPQAITIFHVEVFITNPRNLSSASDQFFSPSVSLWPLRLHSKVVGCPHQSTIVCCQVLAKLHSLVLQLPAHLGEVVILTQYISTLHV